MIFLNIFNLKKLLYEGHGRLARWIKWRTCDVREAKEGLDNELWRRWSNRSVGEWAVMYVGKATEELENELWRRWSDGKVGEWAKLIVIVIAKLILQTFLHFTYFTTHSPTLPSLYLHHSSFSNPSVASPTPQFILQPFFHFSYVTGSSLTFMLHTTWLQEKIS